MSLTGIQLIVIPFALIVIYAAYIHHKKGFISKENLFFWISLWVAFMILAVFPQILFPLITRLKFYRVLDFLMIIAFMILVVLNYSGHLRQQKLESSLKEIIKKLTVVSRKSKVRAKK